MAKNTCSYCDNITPLITEYHTVSYHLKCNTVHTHYTHNAYMYVGVGRLAYEELVGGVLSMRTEHFLRVNGYSNLYWGWGAEDDDMAFR